MSSNMVIHVSSSNGGGAGASAANANRISSLPGIRNSISSLPRIRNSISTLQGDAVRGGQDLPEFVSNYLAASDQTVDFFPALEESLNGMEFELSPDEAVCLDGAREMLAGLHEYMAEVKMKLSFAYLDQLGIQTAQHLHGERLNKRLERICFWKTGSAIFFIGGASIGAAAAVVAVYVKPRRVPAAAAAAASSILFTGVGKLIDSFLEKLENAVKKHKDIMSAINIAGGIEIRNLSTVNGLVDGLQSDAASILKLVENDADEEADVRAKIAALKQSFRDFQREANRCSSDVSSARETVLQSIITNLELSS